MTAHLQSQFQPSTEGSLGPNLRPLEPSPQLMEKQASLNPAIQPQTSFQPTILVVEDSQAVRESLEDLLRGEGYAVRVATDGSQAIEQFQTAPADLVLLDIHLPMQNGWQIFQKIISLNPQQAVIFVSGEVKQPQWILHGKTGVFLEKPLDMAVLLDNIKMVLREPGENRTSRIAIQTALAEFGHPAKSWRDTRPVADDGGLND